MTKRSQNPDYILEDSGLLAGRLLFFNRLGSTNRWALENLDSLVHGDVIEADRQTEGKGRQSRFWFGAGNRGLALSFVLKDLPDLESAPMLGQAAALAVRDVLDSLGIEALLKWPNDVLVSDTKISGILMKSDFKKMSVVVGIGLNVNLTEDDLVEYKLDGKATSIRVVSCEAQDKSYVRDRLIEAYERWLNRFRKKGSSTVIEAWQDTDWLSGSMIEISAEDKKFYGRYLGLDSRGRLRLENDEESEHRFLSGDVKKVRRRTRENIEAEKRRRIVG